jgi:hypothetical protein
MDDDDAGNGWNGSLRKYSKIPELSNVLITFLTARSEDYFKLLVLMPVRMIISQNQLSPN